MLRSARLVFINNYGILSGRTDFGVRGGDEIGV
jgi:hypothetical protein